MDINDRSREFKELGWELLTFGQVYISSRFQKYMIFTQDYKTVCLDSGEVYDEDEHKGDYWYTGKDGEVFEVRQTNGSCPFRVTSGKWKDFGLYEYDVEIIKENVHMFDMRQDKWFIRTPAPEISKIVQEWLFEQGFEWYSSGQHVKHKFEPYIGNATHGEHYMVIDLHEPHSTRKEIKLTFKTIVDSVEYPETFTPEQQQLAQVMQKLDQLKNEAEQLQAIINKGRV